MLYNALPTADIHNHLAIVPGCIKPTYLLRPTPPLMTSETFVFIINISNHNVLIFLPG